jgi:hypothetical protein
MINIQILLLLLVLVLILIIIFNFKINETFTIFDTKIERQKQNYVGPIIFLQRNNKNISQVNCLNETSQYKCIGKYPKEQHYPTKEDLKYISEPNIIKIPRGNTGNHGEMGKQGASAIKSWISTSDISKINSSKYNNLLSLNSKNINFNSKNNIINEFKPLCIIKNSESDEDFCIDRNTIIDIKNSFMTID